MSILCLVYICTACQGPYAEPKLSELGAQQRWSALEDIASSKSDSELGGDAAAVRQNAAAVLARSGSHTAAAALSRSLLARPELQQPVLAEAPVETIEAGLLPVLSLSEFRDAAELRSAVRLRHEDLVIQERARLLSQYAARLRDDAESAEDVASRLSRWDQTPADTTASHNRLVTARSTRMESCSSAACFISLCDSPPASGVYDGVMTSAEALRLAENSLRLHPDYSSEIARLEEEEGALEQSLTDTLNVTIWIHGELAPNHYEVSEAQYSSYAGWLPGTDRYILRTTTTTFTTTGHTKMWLLATGEQESVTLTGGGAASFPVFAEYPVAGAFQSELYTVQQALSETRRSQRSAEKKRRRLEKARFVALAAVEEAVASTVASVDNAL
ncbi:MAG: hypothetical protein P8R54_25225 [Myxococcota bacterium]|nr:hypothetical protein [Myxococcota bacterium]